MKIFFYMRLNPKTKSGISWKIWKIERRGKIITTYWGSAIVERRKAITKGKLRSRSRRFSSEHNAKEYEKSIIKSKLTKGYERKPYRRK